MKINTLEKYQASYKQGIEEPEIFWQNIANHFDWSQKWNSVCEYDMHEAQFLWFKGGKTNITENCIDRHLKTKSNQTAIIFEPNSPKEVATHITL